MNDKKQNPLIIKANNLITEAGYKLARWMNYDGITFFKILEQNLHISGGGGDGKDARVLGVDITSLAQLEVEVNGNYIPLQDALDNETDRYNAITLVINSRVIDNPDELWMTTNGILIENKTWAILPDDVESGFLYVNSVYKDNQGLKFIELNTTNIFASYYDKANNNFEDWNEFIIKGGGANIDIIFNPEQFITDYTNPLDYPSMIADIQPVVKNENGTFKKAYGDVDSTDYPAKRKNLNIGDILPNNDVISMVGNQTNIVVINPDSNAKFNNVGVLCSEDLINIYYNASDPKFKDDTLDVKQYDSLWMNCNGYYLDSDKEDITGITPPFKNKVKMPAGGLLNALGFAISNNTDPNYGDLDFNSAYLNEQGSVVSILRPSSAVNFYDSSKAFSIKIKPTRLIRGKLQLKANGEFKTIYDKTSKYFVAILETTEEQTIDDSAYCFRSNMAGDNTTDTIRNETYLIYFPYSGGQYLSYYDKESKNFNTLPPATYERLSISSQEITINSELGTVPKISNETTSIDGVWSLIDDKTTATVVNGEWENQITTRFKQAIEEGNTADNLDIDYIKFL